MAGTDVPGRDVLTAFGAVGTPEPLPGGRGQSWRVGAIVLKPMDLDPAALAWQAELLDGLDDRPDFRVSPLLRTGDGRLIVSGWTAWRWEPGEHRPGRWADVVRAGDRFHAALTDVPRPAWSAQRTDPWAIADRVAWGEDEFELGPDLDELLAARTPVNDPAQLIHGDLTGNVLFADDLPPLVIDVSPYWRPPGLATAIVVADALVHGGAGPGVLALLDDHPSGRQLLIRALLFRAITDRVHDARASLDHYRAAFALVR